jgi:hypothetical protein
MCRMRNTGQIQSLDYGFGIFVERFNVSRQDLRAGMTRQLRNREAGRSASICPAREC